VTPATVGRLVAALQISLAAPAARAEPTPNRDREITALIAAYPDFLSQRDGNALVWKDGTRMVIDDGKGEKSLDQLFDTPDIDDMFRFSYRLGEKSLPPNVDDDPGRVRYQPFFTKMYGNCQQGGVEPKLIEVPWMPKRGGKPIRFTTVNGADKALGRVVAELEQLPDSMTQYLVPHAGSYNCRTIAGTKRLSMHAYAAAIDINTKYTTYWQWAKPSDGGYYFWTNQVPMAIVRIFEKHGFIWGGRWYHYDTMHFEYRPELMTVAVPGP
jgi:D-alanyl-D-alanine carboxypeptidase